MNFSLTAQLIHVFDTEQITETFRKRDFVVRIDGQYPQEPKFQVIGDKCRDLDQYRLGDTITVHFNVNGRRYEKEGKTNWFTTLQAWKLEGTGTNHIYEQPQPASKTTDFDDVPF